MGSPLHSGAVINPKGNTAGSDLAFAFLGETDKEEWGAPSLSSRLGLRSLSSRLGLRDWSVQLAIAYFVVFSCFSKWIDEYWITGSMTMMMQSLCTYCSIFSIDNFLRKLGSDGKPTSL